MFPGKVQKMREYRMHPQGACRIRGNEWAIPAGGHAASVSQLALATDGVLRFG